MTTTDYQVMPPLTPDELTALRTDITQRGILVPVVRDQHGNLLDGHHRTQIAAELGIECPEETRHVDNHEQARDTAYALNLARRHLNRQQRRDLIAKEITDRPDDSDRAIARRFRCSPSTVGSVRREVSNLDTPPPADHMSREEAERSTQEARAKLEQADQLLWEGIRGGISPAIVARRLQETREQFRTTHADLFGDDYDTVDDILFRRRIDALGAAYAVLSGWKVDDQRAAAWLRAWADLRPDQHQREVKEWKDALTR